MPKSKWWSQDLKAGILLLEPECLAITLYGLSHLGLLPHSLISLIYLSTRLFCLLLFSHATYKSISAWGQVCGRMYVVITIYNIASFSKQTLLHCFYMPTWVNYCIPQASLVPFTPIGLMLGPICPIAFSLIVLQDLPSKWMSAQGWRFLKEY